MLSPEQTFLKSKLKTLLQSNIVEVTFTKKDGTDRTIKCTLDPVKVPQKVDPDAGKPLEEREWREVKHRETPEHLLAVWDLENNAWRSFRIDSVLDYIVTRKEQ